MWSNIQNLVNQASDIAEQAVKQASDVVNELNNQANNVSDSVQERTDKVVENVAESVVKNVESATGLIETVTKSFSEDIKTCEEIDKKAEEDENLKAEIEQQKQATISDPLQPELSDSSKHSDQINNLTKQADQMADTFFSFASNIAKHGLDTSKNLLQTASEQATKYSSIATELGGTYTSIATEKIQEIQSNETFLNVTNTVVNTVVDTIENKTIIGDFHRHQKAQIDENLTWHEGAPTLPWEGYDDFAALKEQVLNLSCDKRTFVRNPPAGVTFQFNYKKTFPSAMAILKEDDNLKKMRFTLVPKKVKEETFWKNYFYRVSLVKQSFQLKKLSNSVTSIGSKNESKSDDQKSENIEMDGNHTVPQDQENFVSTEFGADITADDLKAEMDALNIGDDEPTEEWEKELEFEMINEKDNNKTDENQDWEKEMDDMLA